MTDHTTAAQAASNDFALSDEDLRASIPFQWLARRYTPEVAERMLREHERILLSKLRAPVADERAAFENAWSNRAYSIGHDDKSRALAWFGNGWKAALSATQPEQGERDA